MVAKTTLLLLGETLNSRNVSSYRNRSVNVFAEAVVSQAARWRGVSGRSGMLEKLAAKAAKNPDAVKNLRTMGKSLLGFYNTARNQARKANCFPE